MKVLEIIGSAVSDAVEYVVEKNKIQAQQNRLRMVMRNEADLINRSYIALGKYYYENLRGKDDSEQNRKCCETIDKSSARMQKAADRYRSLIEAQAKVSYDEYAALEDDGKTSPFAAPMKIWARTRPSRRRKARRQPSNLF